MEEPSDLVIFADATGSMGNVTATGTRFRDEVDALEGLIMSTPSGNAAAIWISKSLAQCVPMTYATPEADFGMPRTAALNAVQAAQPHGSGLDLTMMIQGSTQDVSQFVAAHPTHAATAVLVTDGPVFLCLGNNNADGEVAAAVTQFRSATMNRVPFYVYEFGTMPNMQQTAMAGGAPLQSWQTRNDLTPALMSLIPDRRSCFTRVPDKNPDGGVAPAVQVSIEFADAGTLPVDPSDCDGGIGWRTPVEGADLVELCATTCAQLVTQRASVGVQVCR